MIEVNILDCIIQCSRDIFTLNREAEEVRSDERGVEIA